MGLSCLLLGDTQSRVRMGRHRYAGRRQLMLYERAMFDYMLFSINRCQPQYFFVILHMNPAMCGASEEGEHRALGGSFTYERRLLRFISWLLET